MRTYVKRAEPAEAAHGALVENTVRDMLSEIRQNGDAAVQEYANKFDHWDKEFRVTEDEVRAVSARLPETFKEDYKTCLHNIQEFARRQLDSMQEIEVEVSDGVTLGHKHIPLANIGCYIPGGNYPLISATAMSVGTARVAGVDHIIGCAPPRDADGIYGPTLFGFHAAGADEIYCLGGVQAMASMAYGRVGMDAVDMITGPGNSFVAEAKRQLYGIVGIDLMAGPTEICIIADETADVGLVATDLLGQAEHGPDSPAWLVTTSVAFGAAVLAEVERQLEKLPTKDIASVSWNAHGEIVAVGSYEEAVAVSDEYAPEHLELMTANDDYFLSTLKNYGSLFVGEETTVAYGDKGIGTNHTLPTGRAARYTGGLWVGKFLKTVTYQRMTPQASFEFAPIASRQCEAEFLLAHQITADTRRKRFATTGSE